MLDVAVQVRSRRRDLRWTQLRLADAAGVSLKTVQRVELGRPAAKRTILRLEIVLQRELLPPEAYRGVGEVYRERHIGDFVRERRRERRIPLREMADYTGVSMATLSRFERGLPRAPNEDHPLLTTAFALILGLGTSDHLLDAFDRSRSRRFLERV